MNKSVNVFQEWGRSVQLFIHCPLILIHTCTPP